MSQEKNITGLFPVSFMISDGLMGGVSFKVNLLVHTPTKTITGMGQVSQATNPPLNIPTQIAGEYSYMCVMPQNCKILVVAEGCIPNIIIHGAAVTNTKLRMVLEDNWQEGFANFSYLQDGEWQTLEQVQVKKICDEPIIEDNKSA